MIAGNQRPTRMDGLMSNESSHSAATVRAVSIASVPGFIICFLQTNKCKINLGSTRRANYLFFRLRLFVEKFGNIKYSPIKILKKFPVSGVHSYSHAIVTDLFI